jgi:hypothetical protein
MNLFVITVNPWEREDKQGALVVYATHPTKSSLRVDEWTVIQYRAIDRWLPLIRRYDEAVTETKARLSRNGIHPSDPEWEVGIEEDLQDKGILAIPSLRDALVAALRDEGFQVLEDVAHLTFVKAATVGSC